MYRFISAGRLGLVIAPIAFLLLIMATINSSILDISNVVSSADGDDFQVGSLKRIGMLQMLFAKQGGVGIGKIYDSFKVIVSVLHHNHTNINYCS